MPFDPVQSAASDLKFSGDLGVHSAEVSRVTTYLMANYFLEGNGQTRDLYDSLIANHDQVISLLNDVGLDLSLDEGYRVASAYPIEFADRLQPYAIKRRRVGANTTAGTPLLVCLAVLREQCEAHGQNPWYVTRTDILDWFESVPKGVFDLSRIIPLIDSGLNELRGYGFIANTDAQDTYEVTAALASFMDLNTMALWTELLEGTASDAIEPTTRAQSEFPLGEGQTDIYEQLDTSNETQPAER